MKARRIVTLISARILTAAALASMLALVAARAQQPASGVDFPATPAGKLARSLIEAINSGDRGRQLGFIKSGYSDSMLSESPLDEQVSELQRLYEQSGGFELRSIVDSTPELCRFLVRTKRGNIYVRMGVRAGKAQPDRLEAFGVRVVGSPESEKANTWPKEKMGGADAIKEIERRVERAAADDRFSGVVLIAKGNSVVFNKAYGMAEKAFGAPNKIDTKFNLGSMNKMFTSVAIAQLVQAGKLSYDDKLSKVLPDYPNKEVAEKVTIHHLLTHTSGLGDFFKPQFFQNREKYRNPRDYFPIFAADPLQFEPGTRWSYSNASFIVLGAVVEALSGENYFDYVREHIFKPAGMNDTASYSVEEVTPNLAVGYTRFGGNDPLGIEARRANWMSLPLKGSPAGGGYSTAPDLLKFSQALRGHKLLNADLSEKITSGKVETGPGGPARYAYGFFEEAKGGKSVRGHSGGAPGINSDLKIFWDGSYTVIVMGNYDPPAAQGLAGNIADFLAIQ
ncbi:MAG TPA: serine hydrolase domain-containing protein [Blastocatellia bacterium]|jgi:CubicO group peptidase (beta-lactamase class C family)|nr:serine hydrolase domain-containing protein [Blastocatellia bacterium]